MYNRISYGSYSKHLAPMQDLNRKEFNLLLTLLIPTIILGIFPDVILDCLQLSVSTLLYNITATPFFNDIPIESVDNLNISLLEFINMFGLTIDSDVPPIVLLSLYYLILSIFILLNVINIIIYLKAYYIIGFSNNIII